MEAKKLVFDIETVPDVDFGRRLLDLPSELSDEEVARALSVLRAQQNKGSDFPRHHFHRVVAISVVLQEANQIRVWSLGEKHSTEAEIIERFFQGLDKYQPDLISWNGSGFDLPVLHYRALLHGIPAHTYWEMGEHDPKFRWNNYLSRYHFRHLDLMDVLAAYQARAVAPLHEMAVLLGLPGKIGMNGGEVWQAWQAGKIDAIRDYCETDVLNTFLIYLRFQLCRGHLTQDQYLYECERVRHLLASSEAPHLLEFLAAWNH